MDLEKLLPRFGRDGVGFEVEAGRTLGLVESVCEVDYRLAIFSIQSVMPTEVEKSCSMVPC